MALQFQIPLHLPHPSHLPLPRPSHLHLHLHRPSLRPSLVHLHPDRKYISFSTLQIHPNKNSTEEATVEHSHETEEAAAENLQTSVGVPSPPPKINCTHPIATGLGATLLTVAFLKEKGEQLVELQKYLKAALYVLSKFVDLCQDVSLFALFCQRPKDEPEVGTLLKHDEPKGGTLLKHDEPKGGTLLKYLKTMDWIWNQIWKKKDGKNEAKEESSKKKLEEEEK